MTNVELLPIDITAVLDVVSISQLLPQPGVLGFPVTDQL